MKTIKRMAAYTCRQFEHKTLASVFIGIGIIAASSAVGVVLSQLFFEYFGILRK